VLDRGAGGTISLDQLTALNDEIAALVRSGVPLERGLVDAGRQVRGKLGARATALGEHLGRGGSLPEALGPDGLAAPELYRAVVEAGIRSGRLSKALEGMASLARGYAEARRSIGLALLYPTLVLILAYALFLMFVVRVIPRFLAAFVAFRMPENGLSRLMGWAGENVLYWAPIVPLILVFIVLGWLASGRAAGLDAGPLGGLAGRMPWIGRMLSDFRSASFAELLALLLDHQVPLDEAVRLASRASGPGPFRRAGEAFAGRLSLGGGPEARPDPAGSPFPPLLSWMLTAGHRQGGLPSALREASRTYRRKAESRAELLWSTLPVVLMIGLGAGSVAIYGLMMFLPLRALWEDLALPT